MLIRFLIALLLALSPAGAHAAVVFNAASSIPVNTPTNTVTHTHPAIAGSTTLLLVGVQMDLGTASSTSVTHAGSALTKIAGCTTTTGDGFGKIEVWYRLSPASGSNPIVVNLSTDTKFVVGAVSVSGALQVAPTCPATATTGTSSSPTITVSSASAEMVVGFLAVSIESTETATSSGTQTSRWSHTINGSIIGSAGTIPGASSVSLPWTLNDTDAWAMNAVRIQSSGPPDTQAPTAPTNLVANPTSSVSNALSWTASTDNVGVIEYVIERATAGVSGPFTELARPNTTSYTDNNLSANTTYWYRVYANDGTQLSAASGVASATTFALTTHILDWDNNGTYTSVVVMRCAGPGCSNFTDIATLSGSVETYTDTSAPTPVAGYAVRAQLTGASDSGNSNIIYSSSTPPASLGVSPLTLNYSATVGGANPSSQTVNITNCSDCQSMNWTISDNASWLSCTPSSGTNNGSLTCSVNISGLSSGTHLATITVTAPGATNSPTAVSVNLSLSPQTQPGGTTPGTSFGGRVR